MEAALAEVGRREKVFAEVRTASAATHYETPRVAALRSVIEDVITGRF